MVECGCSYHSRTNSKFSSSMPLEVEHFSVLSLFFKLSLPKICPIQGQIYYFSKFSLSKLEIVDSLSI